MLNQNRLYQVMQYRYPRLLRCAECEATALYDTIQDAQDVYFELVKNGFEASCGTSHEDRQGRPLDTPEHYVNAYLTDKQVNEDDAHTGESE